MRTRALTPEDKAILARLRVRCPPIDHKRDVEASTEYRKRASWLPPLYQATTWYLARITPSGRPQL